MNIIRAKECYWINQPRCCQWDSAPTSPVFGGTLLVLAIQLLNSKAAYSFALRHGIGWIISA